MKTISGLLGGGTIIGVWEKIPALIKYPLLFGLGVLAASELNIDVNHALRASQIFGGQAAQGEAQMADPAKTRADMKAGRPVPGATALIGTEVEKNDAEAREKQAIADAANESIEEMRAKQRKGIKLTATEQKLLVEYDTKVAELQIKQENLRQARAEAGIKEAEETAALKTADMRKAIADSVRCQLSGSASDYLYGRAQQRPCR